MMTNIITIIYQNKQLIFVYYIWLFILYEMEYFVIWIIVIFILMRIWNVYNKKVVLFVCCLFLSVILFLMILFKGFFIFFNIVRWLIVNFCLRLGSVSWREVRIRFVINFKVHDFQWRVFLIRFICRSNGCMGL